MSHTNALPVEVLDAATRPIGIMVADSITMDDFCLADAAGAWLQRSVINGTTILYYPCAALMCDTMGHCSAAYQAAIDLWAHVGVTQFAQAA